MTVPFDEPARAQRAERREEIEGHSASRLTPPALSVGRAMAAFEARLAPLRRPAAISVASGTDALGVAPRGSVGEGDTIVTVPNTFIATVEAFLQLGAVPQFIDIDPRTYNIDVALLRDYLRTACTVDARGVLRERVTGLRRPPMIPSTCTVCRRHGADPQPGPKSSASRSSKTPARRTAPSTASMTAPSSEPG
ncbi:MAG: DegT/DnrJ/EryC1/StrS family aminotransferase [Dehalococcoidia bacterium]